MTTIAALYVATGGAYFNLPDVDPWNEARDARLYPALNFKRYGGEHNRPGNDGGCFASALASVRTWGGVLEHPASSKAWAAHRLPTPRKGRWIGPDPAGGYVCEVSQAAYGHRARKLTWLYYVGKAPPPAMLWEQPAGTAQVGWFDRKKPTLGKSEAKATPPAFRDALLALARGAR